jgi:hypothetical protein
MRPLVEPPPSMLCGYCCGELRFKQLIELADHARDLDKEILVCIKCGREQSYIVRHDQNMPHLKSAK